MSYEVRDAAPADAEAVARLDAEQHDRDALDVLPLIRAELERIAAGAVHRTCAVAIVDGEIVAYARSGFNDYAADPGARGLPSGWYLTGLVVSPRHRRAGIGAALTRHRLAHLRRLGVAEVRYFTSADNTASIALHEALGFCEITRDVAVPRIEFRGGEGILFWLPLR